MQKMNPRERLTPEETEVFRELLRSSLQRYGMMAADIADHKCAYAPDPVAKKNFDAISMGFAPCVCKSIKRQSRSLRDSVKSAVQNALNQARAPLHSRAYALIRLLETSEKAREWRRAHPGAKDPLIELHFRHPVSLRFLWPPILPYAPPERYPEVALTPHGVERLADVLVGELSRRKMIRQAKCDVRNAISDILREMHDNCNEAFVQRIEYSSNFRRVDMTTETVPIKSKVVRERAGIETTTHTTYAVRKRSMPRPEGATDADTFRWLDAMLWDQWALFGKLAREKLFSPAPVEYPKAPKVSGR